MKLSHKTRMYLTVFSLLTVATAGAIVSGKVHSRELDLQLKTQQVYAIAPVKPYTEPAINTNTNEVEYIKGLIRKIWGKDASIGLAIARCESGYNPKAKNHNTDGTWDLGVFQINSIHNMPEMLDAVANIAYAYSLYLTQGTTPWNSSRECWK